MKYYLWSPKHPWGWCRIFWIVVALDKTHPSGAHAASNPSLPCLQRWLELTRDKSAAPRWHSVLLPKPSVLVSPPTASLPVLSAASSTGLSWARHGLRLLPGRYK